MRRGGRKKKRRGKLPRRKGEGLDFFEVIFKPSGEGRDFRKECGREVYSKGRRGEVGGAEPNGGGEKKKKKKKKTSAKGRASTQGRKKINFSIRETWEFSYTHRKG